MTEMTSELIQRPIFQVLLFLLLTIASIFIIGPKSADKTWIIAGLFFIAFILLNSVMIFIVPNNWSYFFYSIGLSILYLICISFIIPATIKLLKIEGSGESAMVFLFIIYHPVFLLCMLFLKWVYFKLF